MISFPNTDSHTNERENLALHYSELCVRVWVIVCPR